MAAEPDPILRVGVVIASWEDHDNTAQCLASLLAMTELAEAGVEMRVVISDDGSSEAITSSLAQLVESYAGRPVALQLASRRGGFGATINRGIAALADFGPDYYWLLNNDIRVDTAALAALAGCARRQPQVGIWGSTVVAGLDGATLQCAGGYRYSRFSTRSFAQHAGAALETVAALPEGEMDYVAGASMFCRAELLAALAGLSEDYFLYFEELDLLQRSPDAVPLGWCRASVVYHGRARSTSSPGQQRSALQQYYENYSTLLYTRRYDPWLLPWVLLSRCLVKPWWFLWRREWHLYRPFALALFDFLRGASPRRFS